MRPSERLVAIEQTFNLGESWAKGLTLRPDYQQAVLELERQKILLRFRENQRLPSLDLIGSYAANGVDTSGYGRSIENIDRDNPRYFYGLVFSIPLFNTDAKSRYNITKAEKERALLGMKSLEQTVLAEIDDAVKVAQASFQRVDATY